MPKNSVQVVAKNEETKQFKLAVGELEEILLQDDVKDREIVVISIAGAFRKGKSFMLNFFLKYLNEVYVKKSLINDWLGSGDDSLNGFKWCGGVRRVTTGIHMWNEIFTHDYDDGRKVAIVLLDTQGTFDRRTTMKDCTTIFALSTLLSSVQIFNVMQNIQEDDLQHLQLFSEYGRLAAKSGDSKPFQKLMFLVRDWNCPYKHEYGLIGGQEFLEERLSIQNDHEREHRSLRSHLCSCFDQLRCFLMPYPGRSVTADPNFNGQLSEIEEDFKTNLKELVPHLLAPRNLSVKKINGVPIKAYEFHQYLERYFEILNSPDMPRAMPIFQATAEIHNTNAVCESQSYYASQMQSVRSNIFRLNNAALEEHHVRARREALDRLEQRQLMGQGEFILTFKRMLDEFIERSFSEFSRQNQPRFDLKNLIAMLALTAVTFTLNPSTAFIGRIVETFPVVKYVLQLIRMRRQLR